MASNEINRDAAQGTSPDLVNLTESFNGLQIEDTVMDWAPSKGQASFNGLQIEDEETFTDCALSEGQASNVVPPASSTDEEDPMEVDQQE